MPHRRYLNMRGEMQEFCIIWSINRSAVMPIDFVLRCIMSYKVHTIYDSNHSNMDTRLDSTLFTSRCRCSNIIHPKNAVQTYHLVKELANRAYVNRTADYTARTARTRNLVVASNFYMPVSTWLSDIKVCMRTQP